MASQVSAIETFNFLNISLSNLAPTPSDNIFAHAASGETDRWRRRQNRLPVCQPRQDVLTSKAGQDRALACPVDGSHPSSIGGNFFACNEQVGTIVPVPQSSRDPCDISRSRDTWRMPGHRRRGFLKLPRFCPRTKARYACHLT